MVTDIQSYWNLTLDFYFFMISLKDITIDFQNKNNNKRNRWITSRQITGTGWSKKNVISTQHWYTLQTFQISLFLPYLTGIHMRFTFHLTTCDCFEAGNKKFFANIVLYIYFIPAKKSVLEPILRPYWYDF
jgi:hypothetical protein